MTDLSETIKFYTASVISVVSGIITLSDVAIWLEISAAFTALATGAFAIKKYFRHRDLDMHKLENEKLLTEIRQQELFQLMKKNKEL